MFRLVPRILIIVAICVGVALFLSRALGASGPVSTPWSGTNTSSTMASAGGQTAANGQQTDSSTTDGATRVQGPDGDNDAGQNEQTEPNDQAVTGTVATVDAAQSMFTLTTTANNQMLIVTNGQTEYGDGLSTTASIHSGTTVTIEGSAQPDGRFLASDVKGTSEAPDANNGND